jgi:uncharacterized protein (DUF2141 family)
MSLHIKSIISLFLLSFVCIGGIAQNDSTTITVNVIDLRSNEGKVGLTLFNAAEGFPSKPEMAIDKKYVDISNLTATAAFEKVKPGKYAIAVYHDEDEDGEIETNWIGIPKEGTGSSNNPKSRMGPPRYEDCEFDTRETRQLTIRMKYF